MEADWVENVTADLSLSSIWAYVFILFYFEERDYLSTYFRKAIVI